MVQFFLGDSGSSVLNLNLSKLIRAVATGVYSQFSSCRHGLNGIKDKIEKALLQLVGIALYH